MALLFKHSYPLRDQYNDLTEYDGLAMKVPVDGVAVSAKVIKRERHEGWQIETLYQAEISPELVENYEKCEAPIWDARVWPRPLLEQHVAIENRADVAAHRMLFALKFLMMLHTLPVKVMALSPGGWSKDGETWNKLPLKLSESRARLIKMPDLDDSAKLRLQQFLNDSEELLMPALLHLHRAKQQDEERYRWIDATIAAELAIKEFLIRKYPAFETLFLELPSPPLDKLYGKILESLVGERSPSLKALGEGAKTRNKLIHRPTAIEIHEDKLWDYIEAVEVAIYHLMSFLYPDNHLIRHQIATP